MSTSPHRAEILLDTKSILAEGPVWDWKKQSLFWVDIEGRKLHRYQPVNKQYTEWSFKEMIGAAVPTEDGCWLLALEKGLALFDLELENLAPCNVLENSNAKMRYNDGKVGPNGSFYIGSMHKEFIPESGNLYQVTPDLNAQVEIPKTTISNGLAWSADEKTLYFSDSAAHEICTYDVDSKSGSLSHKKSIITFPESYGSSDGLCIDQEGMLWVAHWGGHCIRRWDPETREVLKTIQVDAPHVTSCCFGGKNLDTLYITTARSGLDEKQLQNYPLSGGIFFYRPEVKGTPITYFKNS
ncbi:MAG: SMP-30/gluconolactonase/LRE family protein [Pricia sp.]|nr:SMP-30/gluconolactonase/LRE family protein [Pricia sp.]